MKIYGAFTLVETETDTDTDKIEFPMANTVGIGPCAL